MERFNRLDWPIQKERILAFCRKWRGLLVMDATGVGDPIYDDLSRVWPRIAAGEVHQPGKDPVGSAARGRSGAADVSWPRAWSVLTDELKRYEYAIGASGSITYSAPSGFHDDCVMALALAVSGRQNDAHVGSMVRLQAFRNPSFLSISERAVR